MSSRKADHKEISDLVRLAQKGYKGPMEELIRLSEDLVYYNCLHMLKNRDDAQEMTQEVYLTVFEKLSTLKKREAFLKWVKIITINKCKNKLQQGNPYFLLEDLTKMDESVDAMELVEDRSDQSSPEKVLDNKETEQTLLNLINGLPDAQRMCIVMFYYDEMSINDIATILGVSPNTVKSRLTYARAKLRDGIKKESHEGFNLHGYQPAAFTAFVAYYLHKTAKPDDGRIGTLISLLRAWAGAGTASSLTAGVSAADALIAEEAAALCGISGSAAAVSGGIGAFFGTAFWTSLTGKALAISAAAVLAVGGIFGAGMLLGDRLNAEPSSSLVEAMDEQKNIRTAEGEGIFEQETEASSYETSREPSSRIPAESSETGELSSAGSSEMESAQESEAEESNEEPDYNSEDSQPDNETSSQESGTEEENSDTSQQNSSGGNQDNSSQNGLEEGSSENSSEESSDNSSEESSEESSETSSQESSEESSENSSENNSEENSDVDSSLSPDHEPTEEELAYKHQKWDEFMVAFTHFQDQKTLQYEINEIDDLLLTEGAEESDDDSENGGSEEHTYVYQGTSMTYEELVALRDSKYELLMEGGSLQTCCQQAKDAYNEWAVLWQMVNIYLEEPGDQERSNMYAPINTNELYFY